MTNGELGGARRQGCSSMTALREAALQALDDLKDLHINHNITLAGTIWRLEAALAQEQAEPVQEPVAHSVIAGALFDFMGWLTSRKECIVLSSANNASPAVEAITEFAKMRGLSLDDAKVQEWQEHLAAPPKRKPLTDEEIVDATEHIDTSRNGYFIDIARAIERAHGIGSKT